MSEFSISEFSEILTATIKLRGLTNTEFAEKMGMDITVLSRYVTGHSEPKIGRVIKMAKVLDVSVDYLVGNSDDDPRAELLEQRVAEIAEELETLQKEIETIRSKKRRNE